MRELFLFSSPLTSSHQIATIIYMRLLFEKKRSGEKIVALTAYDTPTARILDEAGIDLVLVGDSVGMVLLGYPSTRFVTMEEMLHHIRAVRRGVKRAVVIGDLPYHSYRTPKEALSNARRFLEAGCDGVKVEGGEAIALVIRHLRRHRIPVQGHLGLLPQSVKPGDPFRLKARTAEAARRLLEEAGLLEALGVFSLVLECVPQEVAAAVTRALRIPTIGIGSGSECDGQILVINDLLGLTPQFSPRFVKQYADLSKAIRIAVGRYGRDVRSGRFPTQKQAFRMEPEERRRFQALSRTPFSA